MSTGNMALDLAQADLEAAEHAAAEHGRLTERAGRAAAALADAQTTLSRARAALADEAKDVERLDGFSPTLIWAVLRGNRDERLEAERAEQRAAEYTVALAESRLASAEGELAAARATIGALGDVRARRTAALDAKERAVVAGGHPGAAELDDLARRTGAARSELTEVREVVAAAAEADRTLRGALGCLDTASNWAAYDTFGGGFLADMAKRDKMDEAVEWMRTADRALRRLSTELGDLGHQGVGGVDVGALAGAFDVWFDNIFSDWSVMHRIDEARNRVRNASAAVDRVRASTGARAVRLEKLLADLAARREALLLSA
ncbi:hypothetical protein L1785_14170 [Antribacter sp. KLBMP9083]|uniref:Uncharacterized protein n=1 Tax=Antribacter soli TaxID=2910976 RepID=A0AA41QHD7_9MICO|nr:hypothetical protein [Antribacter soli]MCF4122124.1 hypothetical protein [Antribacter soli]